MWCSIFSRPVSPNSAAQDWFNQIRKITSDPAEYGYKSDAEIQAIAKKLIQPLKTLTGEGKPLTVEIIKQQILPLHQKDSRFPHEMIKQIGPFLATNAVTFQPIYNDLRSVNAGVDLRFLL